MTSLAVALSVDARGPAGLYIVTDSRITWPDTARWDAGQKTFVSARTPDVFGFLGDAFFPPAMLRQIIDQVNAGLLLTVDMDAEERHRIIAAALRSAMAMGINVNVAPFAIFHAARQNDEMKSRFRLFHTKYGKSTGWIDVELDLDPDRSYLAHLDGSGRQVMKARRKDWIGTEAEGSFG